MPTTNASYTLCVCFGSEVENNIYFLPKSIVCVGLFPRLVFRIYSDDDEVCVCVALGEGRLRVTKPVYFWLKS